MLIFYPHSWSFSSSHDFECLSLLKKRILNKDSMKNYRPVSNLSFLSNVLEKIMVNQLNSHISSSNTSNQYQSTYRRFHSTENVLRKIHNDIIASMDADRVTALTLLHLSTAFDAIDHSTLLRRLDEWFALTGKALDWFKSYLTGGCQRIKLVDYKAYLNFRVPQGSVLGPLLSPFTPLHWVAWSLDMLSLTFFMLTTASCMFHLHQGTLRRHWMVYSHVWSRSGRGCRINWNWNWTEIKRNSALSKTNDSRANFLSKFPSGLFGVKTNPAKSAQNLIIIGNKLYLPHTCIRSL